MVTCRCEFVAMKTLTLRGKPATEAGTGSRGALHAQPAIEHATCRGYDGQGAGYRRQPAGAVRNISLALDEYRR